MLALPTASAGETLPQPHSWARTFLHLPDNHTSNPPGGLPASPPQLGPTALCNELLISALLHRSLNTSTHVFGVQCTQSLISTASLSLSITKASKRSVMDLRTNLLHQPRGIMPWYFLIMFLFLGVAAFGLISLSCWLANRCFFVVVVVGKDKRIALLLGGCKSTQSSWQDSYWLILRLCPWASHMGL